MDFTPSLSVENPEIAEVQDMQTGLLMQAGEVIGADYGATLALRMALRQAIANESPMYTCPLCGVPVYLVSRMESRKFFFRHDLEDGRCPARTRGQLNEEEINARKYNGAKESQAHLRLKEIIATSLRRDPGFTNVQVESVWKGQDRVAWRKPDVQAVYNGIRVAFEIQLSTTFLRVIAERRNFYLQEGGLLVWIFNACTVDRPRLTQDDVFYNNNRNLFLASEETLAASQQASKLVLDCRWAALSLNGEELSTEGDGRFVAFDELILDRERQRVFLYDFDLQAAELLKQTPSQRLRDEFESFWLNSSGGAVYEEADWHRFRTRFLRQGVELPRYPSQDGLQPLLRALYSAKHGKPIGWSYQSFIEVAHRVVGGYPQLLRLFRRALLKYRRGNQLEQEDHTGKWRIKVEKYKQEMRDNNPLYEPDRRHWPLVVFLFPELDSSNI